MVAESWINPEDWYRTKVVSNSILIKELSKLKIKKYINFSTPEVYGNTSSLKRESNIFTPTTPYAISRSAQDLNLIAYLKLVGKIHIKDKNLRKVKIEKIISQFEFDPLLKIKAKHLSGGQKKKLVISMALINDPKILLLDEPFAALDILTIKMLQEVIVNLQSMEKITVVVCDHQARDLLSCVDRAIVLSNGKIIASGSPNEIIKDSSAKSAYFGDEFKIN